MTNQLIIRRSIGILTVAAIIMATTWGLATLARVPYTEMLRTILIWDGGGSILFITFLGIQWLLEWSFKSKIK